jgi:hypothetical protein
MVAVLSFLLTLVVAFATSHYTLVTFKLRSEIAIAIAVVFAVLVAVFVAVFGQSLV